MSDVQISIILNALKGGALALLVLWTVVANSLVFLVLYKNPRLQTVPNLLVANLAFSDLCLGIIVLPLSSIYAIANEWLFTSTLCAIFVSADILCSTASIWNLSIVGLDRYWAITSPTAYMSKRNKRTAAMLIILVWMSSALISLAPLLGWSQVAGHGNMVQINGTWQCVFLDLPSYTIYSATGSFFIPLGVMFFVYYKIYQAFAEHRARQIYRQKVLRKHIESTILHELNDAMMNSEDVEIDDSDSESSSTISQQRFIREPDNSSSESMMLANTTTSTSNNEADNTIDDSQQGTEETKLIGKQVESSVCTEPNEVDRNRQNQAKIKKSLRVKMSQNDDLHSEKMRRTTSRSTEQKPKAISAAKERRGVKVLGIILGCFTICWTPFFVMYVLVQFCSSCRVNPHVSMFITWLGYSNSAMNPIIYTVFNRDYQNGLKKLFRSSKRNTHLF